MKKIFIIFILAIISLGVKAQSQRLVLAEEFTHASCIYCAEANLAFNALLNANTTKISALKYHVNWPAVGVDPMSTQTQTWVNPRITLDTVNAIPLAFMDGGYPSMIGLTYLGYPGNFSQHVIDSVYAIPSPFSMNLSYSFTPAYDSVNVRCVFTCTQAITMSTPKLQVAMIEKHIHFTTAPGTDGETDFYNEMRCMYPDGNGTTLNTTWIVGDKDSLVFKTIIPSYIYEKGEIAFVAFIQDNAGAPTCNVKQAAYCAPQPILLDASIINLKNIPTSMQCSASFTPSIELENTGLTTLTSATISYQLNNGTAIDQPWTGSLSHGDSVLITLPVITGINGVNTYTVSVSSPNGGTDQNPLNDAITESFPLSLATPIAIPLTQGFESTTFPPTNWILNNPDNSNTWARSTSAGGFGNTTNSSKIDFYNIRSGTNDMIVAPIDLSGVTQAAMTFSVAHAQYNSASIDELQVLVSVDCGTTWNVAYDKKDPALATTTTDYTTEFVPTSTQWRTDTVNLNSYIGESSVFIDFRGITGYSNDCYVDDINISQMTVGINELSGIGNLISIYPNPVSEEIQVISNQCSVNSIEIYNMLGEKIYSLPITDNRSPITINCSSFAKGIYFVTLTTEEGKAVKKFIKE